MPMSADALVKPVSVSTYRTSHYDVGMSFEDLDDFARLQVPQVDLVVLAARDDPLPAGDAEARRDAEFLVDVACVRLQAAGGVVVPQPDSAVVGRGKDVLRVGGELHVLAECGVSDDRRI